MPSPGEPVHKGTLVCVVLKAKNLPNKRSIGKQDPYCVLAMGSEQQKTKPDKRGGQHPTWDEQLHFEVYEDMEDALAKKGNDGSVSKASGSAVRGGKSGGKKILKVSCYADDNKDPEFIGEGMVDLTETLKTGEFDEWVPIKAKERYAGEVYLELTFYSAAAPPKRKKAIKPVVSGNDTYGGAGTFQDIDDLGEPPAAPPKGSPPPDEPELPASMRPGAAHRSQMSSSMSVSNLSSLRPSSGMTHSATMSDIPSSLRPSSSLAQIDAYTPPYAPASIARGSSPAPPPMPQQHQPSQPTDVSGEFGQHPRRDSFVAGSSEYGMMPSASYYGHTASASTATVVPNTYHANGMSRYGTVSSLASTSSYSQMPTSATMSHISSSYGARPDPTEQLTHSMSAMSFQQPSSGVDRPLAPHTPQPATPQTPVPQSHIYQHPSQSSSIYSTHQPTPPPQPVQAQQQHHQHSYTPQPSHPHAIATPPPHPASAPPTQGEYGPPSSQYYGGAGGSEPPRPVSPAASTYSTVAPTVVNAQAYYQPHGGGNGSSTLQSAPSHLPPRSSSPALSTHGPGGMPHASPYAYDGGSSLPLRRAPRPLPSTQPMAQHQVAAAAAGSGLGPGPGPGGPYGAYPPSSTPTPTPPGTQSWQQQQHAAPGAGPPYSGLTHSYSQTWSTAPAAPAPGPYGAPPAAPPQGQAWSNHPPPQPQAYGQPYDAGYHAQQPPPVPQQGQQGAHYQGYAPPPPPPHQQGGMAHTTSYSSNLYGQ